MIMFTFHVTSNAICALEDSADAAADGPCQCSVWYTREQHLTVKPLSCLELTYDYELLKRRNASLACLLVALTTI